MSFNKIDKNQPLIEKLEKVILSNKIHHGYIFEGPLTVDKLFFAESFVKAIFCKDKPGKGCGTCVYCKKIENGNHLDITIIEAEAGKGRKVKSVKDEQIERVQERLGKKPFEGDRNIVIIKDADTMSVKAFNRFLKTLEEPPLGTVIIMLSENANQLPETILSRCVLFRVNPWNDESHEEMRRIAEKLIAALKEKKPYYEVKKILDSVDKEKKEAELLLDSMEEVYRNKLIEDRTYGEKNIYDYIGTIEKTRRDIKQNINIGNSLKLMTLTIGG